MGGVIAVVAPALEFAQNLEAEFLSFLLGGDDDRRRAIGAPAGVKERDGAFVALKTLRYTRLSNPY